MITELAADLGRSHGQLDALISARADTDALAEPLLEHIAEIEGSIADCAPDSPRSALVAATLLHGLLQELSPASERCEEEHRILKLSAGLVRYLAKGAGGNIDELASLGLGAYAPPPSDHDAGTA